MVNYQILPATLPEPSFKDRASSAGVTEAVSLLDLDISCGWGVYKGFGAAVLDPG